MNPSTDDFERDFYFRVPHPTLAWSVLEVLVRRAAGCWQYAYGYQLGTCGFGSPFTGMTPSRENAGRIGLVRLRNALTRFAGDDHLDGRDCDQTEAAKHAARIEEMLHPMQPELFALTVESPATRATRGTAGGTKMTNPGGCAA